MSEERMTVRGRLVRYIHEDDHRAPVDRASQTPDFLDEATAQAWWNEHRFTEEFWRTGEPVPDSELPPVRTPLDPAALDKDVSTVVRDAAIVAGLAFAAGVLVAFEVAYVLFRRLGG